MLGFDEMNKLSPNDIKLHCNSREMQYFVE